MELYGIDDGREDAVGEETEAEESCTSSWR